MDVVGGQVRPSAAIVHIAVGLDQHECIGARLAEESVDIRQPEAVRTMMPKNNSGWLATADLPVLAGRLVTGSQAGYVDGETCGLLKRIWTGDVGLAKTYWIFGYVLSCVGGLVATMAVLLTAAASVDGCSSSDGGVFRGLGRRMLASASQYRSPCIWAWAGKATIIRQGSSEQVTFAFLACPVRLLQIVDQLAAFGTPTPDPGRSAAGPPRHAESRCVLRRAANVTINPLSTRESIIVAGSPGSSRPCGLRAN